MSRHILTGNKSGGRPPARAARVWWLVAGSVVLTPLLAGEPIDLGRLANGATVSFERETKGWGIAVRGGPAPGWSQPTPLQIEVGAAEGDGRALAAAYDSVGRAADGVEARGVVTDGAGVFRVQDHWSLHGAELAVRRTVAVERGAAGGFASSVTLEADPAVRWETTACLAPGAVYGDPTYDGERSPGGTLNYAARRFQFREDMLPAPLLALSLGRGASVALLDPAPRGDSTVEETKLAEATIIDGRFQFGTLGVEQPDGAPLRLTFQYPGSVRLFNGPPDANRPAQWFRRYHPIEAGYVQRYEVRFRFGEDESFRDLTRDAWRWAWDTLRPTAKPIDVEEMRRVLLDHLEAQAATIDGRTAIPFVLSTVTDQRQWNWTMVAMGFVGKNIECADLLLREGDRDHGERGRRMRATGLAIIDSLVAALPEIPLRGAGYDLATGQPWDHIWLAPWLRNATEDMRVLMKAWRRERALGREHPAWFDWTKRYVDWLIQQQREDGSFPRRWRPGTSEVAEATGTTSYCPVPLLLMMSEETGDPRYRNAAVRAAEYVWSSWGERGLFIGGASDNPNITDKEAGMLSMEAFLSLYESTKEPKWLERAQAAGNFAESWIWIWNLPMPLDADDARLHWKKGVPTIGLQGITAGGVGGADEYLDWAVPSYAKLYRYTQDPHYFEVARILLHATKSMVAMPGRQYDMKGIGWQQEHWRLGPGGSGRGVGSHRFWLPWITANHLAGIFGLEEFDPRLFAQLSKAPIASPSASDAGSAARH